MRGAVGLSALVELPVLWVWTHDSVGLGEDGPTHQPVEHFSALRAIPKLWVFRPGDPNETSVAWRVALERETGPVALLLSRQNIETLDREEVAPVEGVLRGAYVLWDAPGGEPELIRIATGTELGTTLAAARLLAGEGRRARVVPMPCMEPFEEQGEADPQEVLPAAITAKLPARPAARLTCTRRGGAHGDLCGLDRFGASAK